MSPHFTLDSNVNFKDEPLASVETVFPDIHANPTTLPRSLDPFTITTTTGFLPLQPPQLDLPPAFDVVKKLLNDFPVVKEDGTPGLLAAYQLGPTIDSGVLPDLSNEIGALLAPDGKPDLVAVTTVFREYAFLSSGYLLEPCWERWSKGLEGYGLGRATLPRCLAAPLVKAANILDIPPFMSYAAAYTLFNYRFVDPEVGGSSYQNLRLVRAFERGLNPSSSEAGFVLTHVDMVQHSAGLVRGVVGLLDAAAATDKIAPSPSALADNLSLILATMRSIDASMDKMWSHSAARDYPRYRTFIFGIANQPMFPEGVIFAGTDLEGEPCFPRGESGANDSMIPLLDAALEIRMPPNPLTAILADFGAYRPAPHRAFLAWVRARARTVAVRDACCANSRVAELYLRLLDAVRAFRWRHWLFAREYILRRTRHAVATGGSPMATWLPNQLFAVMDSMSEVWGLMGEVGEDVKEMMARVEEQRSRLEKEVGMWCRDREVEKGA